MSSRSALEILIDNLLANNTNGDITDQDVRDVVNAIKDADFNLTDDNASNIPYTPTTPTNWADTITNVLEALDSLAKNSERVLFKANTDDTVSNIQPFYGQGNLIGDEVFNSTRVSSLTYQVSSDNKTWALVNGTGTYNDLKTEIGNMSPAQLLYVRVIFVFVNNEFGEELFTLKYKNK